MLMCFHHSSSIIVLDFIPFKTKHGGYIKVTDEVLTGGTQKKRIRVYCIFKSKRNAVCKSKGYWEDKLYWMIKFKTNMCVLF